MNTTLEREVIYKPAPSIVRNNNRDLVRWDKMKVDDLRATIELLDRHQSPYLPEAVYELQCRYARAEIHLVDAPQTPPPSRGNVPRWLYKWPFKLFWSQRP